MVIQDLRDEMRLLRSGRCNMDYQFAVLTYLQSHQLFDPLLRNAEFAAKITEANSIAFSSVSGAAANQLLEDLHLTEADGFEEAPFETPAG